MTSSEVSSSEPGQSSHFLISVSRPIRFFSRQMYEEPTAALSLDEKWFFAKQTLYRELGAAIFKADLATLDRFI